MKYLFYADSNVCDDEMMCVDEKDFQKKTGVDWTKMVMNYATKYLKDKEWRDMTFDAIENLFIERLFNDPTVRANYGFIVTDAPKDEDCDDEDDDENDETRIRICVPSEDGVQVLSLNKIDKTTYAKTGCPICDGRLKVIGKSDHRTRMPNIYISVCQLCGAQIGFTTDETKFFPLTEE